MPGLHWLIPSISLVSLFFSICASLALSQKVVEQGDQGPSLLAHLTRGSELLRLPPQHLRRTFVCSEVRKPHLEVK